jgi:hypothetical protein
LSELPALVAAQAHFANELLESGGAMRLTLDLAKDGLVSQHAWSVYRRDAAEESSLQRTGADASGVTYRRAARLIRCELVRVAHPPPSCAYIGFEAYETQPCAVFQSSDRGGALDFLSGTCADHFFLTLLHSLMPATDFALVPC